eukprot:1159460-Pelagomonas_calceolata.AAC.7
MQDTRQTRQKCVKMQKQLAWPRNQFFELLQHFRVDVYGNVVALDAVPGSPAAFSMDHIMPWSRGGLTKTENLMALSELRLVCN